MRASFFLVLAVALLVGLGVAVAVKSLGLLTPHVVEAPPQTLAPAPPAPPPPAPRPLVLAAARNLYASDTIRPGDVLLRTARPEEVAELEKNKPEYVQPVLEAVYFRFAGKDIEADTPIKKAYLKEMTKPEALHARLAPGTRAVNVGSSKANSAGGLIQVTDWVDVYLTTDVGRTDEPGLKAAQTGLIARHVQVIAKRDSLWSGLAPYANETTIQYTLAANPFRAALLDYAKTVGFVTLVPVSEKEKKQLDDKKSAALADEVKASGLALSGLSASAAEEEKKRITEYEGGGLALGGDDIAKALHLKPIPSPVFEPEPAPVPPLTVEVFSGTRKEGNAVFEQPQPPARPKKPAPTPQQLVQGRYVFSMPALPGSGNVAGKDNPGGTKSSGIVPTPNATTNTPGHAQGR